MVRIMLADDHLLFRCVVREILEREPDLEVIAEAGDGQEAAQQAEKTQPDVILMDLNMPVCDGFQATEQVLACSPLSRVVIFSASSEEQHVLRALQCGAIGYITKDIDAQGLLTAIRQAARNDLYMAHPLATRVLAFLRTLKFDLSQKTETTRTTDTSASLLAPKKSKRHLPLTGRERQILNLIRQGWRNREIASELRIAESTVHKHVQHILEKLNARNRAEALFLSRN